MNKYPILQSGFIAFTDEKLLTPVKYNDLVISNVLSKDFRSPSNKYFFSEAISKLYTLWSSNPKCLLDFDTREKLLKVAKELFNSNSFFKWVNLQAEHGELGNLHEAFLIETLGYISTGTRKLEVSQWISLLEKSFKSKGVAVSFNQFFDKELYGKKNGYDKIVPSLLVDTLTEWVRHPKGYEDLLLSLYVIFGNRPHITDVSENPRI